MTQAGILALLKLRYYGYTDPRVSLQFRLMDSGSR